MPQSPRFHFLAATIVHLSRTLANEVEPGAEGRETEGEEPGVWLRRRSAEGGVVVFGCGADDLQPQLGHFGVGQGPICRPQPNSVRQ